MVLCWHNVTGEPPGVLPYWAKHNTSGHSSGSDKLDNVLKLIAYTGYRGVDGRYTYRSHIPVPGSNNKKFTVETVIVDPYGVEQEGKLYFRFTKKGAYLTNPRSVDTSNPKYDSKKVGKLSKIAQQLYAGKLAPGSYSGNEDDNDFASAAYDALIASQFGAHPGRPLLPVAARAAGAVPRKQRRR
ncbi:hypothetical protein VTI28DRAFT_3122 [Corynascus sepedonium]